MVITRKIQVYVYEPDSIQKKEYIHTLYEWRNLIRRAANMIVTHKFMQQQICDFMYLKEDIKEKFGLKDILKEEKGNSPQNTTYKVISKLLKGKVPSDIYSCLNQSVSNTYKESSKNIFLGKASVQSFKNNLPIPFSAKSLSNMHMNSEDNKYYFTLFGIPFSCILGRDRSNNQAIIDKCISGEYKMCSSSLQIDDNKKKMFLLLCVDIPTQNIRLIEGKKLYARLDINIPIICSTEIIAKQEYDSGNKIFKIGTLEEFNYRRLQIQEGLKRMQIVCRYNTGGKGRKRKLEAIERYKKCESNYVDTKLHTYSKMLVDIAKKHECDEIVLLDQISREEDAKQQSQEGNDYILRNWSYYNLKNKIEYKAKIYGIKISVQN